VTWKSKAVVVNNNNNSLLLEHPAPELRTQKSVEFARSPDLQELRSTGRVQPWRASIDILGTWGMFQATILAAITRR
jgi:hypothetical protein